MRINLFISLALLTTAASAQDSHVQGNLEVDGNLQVDGTTRIDGGADLVGQGLAVYTDTTTYEGGGDPVMEISAQGIITLTEPAGDISMGAFAATVYSYESDFSNGIDSWLSGAGSTLTSDGTALNVTDPEWCHMYRNGVCTPGISHRITAISSGSSEIDIYTWDTPSNQWTKVYDNWNGIAPVTILPTSSALSLRTATTSFQLTSLKLEPLAN